MTNEQKEDLKEDIKCIQNGKYGDVIEFSEFDFHANVFDSRDLQEELDKLQSEYDALVEAFEEEESDENAENLINWLEEYKNPFLTLLEAKEESEQYAGDSWEDGITFIADDYFEDYAQELAEDIGAIDKHAQWPLQFVDWEAAANDLQMDYTSVTIDDRTYWVR